MPPAPFLLDVLDTFYQISGLIVNMEKTKMTTIKAIQPRHYPTFTYKGQPIEVVQTFKYLDINVCLINKKVECIL